MIYLLHAFPPFPPLLSIDLVIEKTMHRDDSTRILPPPRLKGSYLSFAENQNPGLFCRHGYDPGDDHFDVRLSLRFVHKSDDPLALRTLISPLQRSPFLSHLMTHEPCEGDSTHSQNIVITTTSCIERDATQSVQARSLAPSSSPQYYHRIFLSHFQLRHTYKRPPCLYLLFLTVCSNRNGEMSLINTLLSV